MDVKETFLRISQNDANLGQCDSDTAANILNNEDSLDKPATYFMYEPKETNPNGSIAVNQTRAMLETGSYDGAGETLSNARLYAFFKPIQKELFEKEEEYKKLVFDNSNFFYRFGKDYMRNWYSLKRNAALYKMSKAQQDGDVVSALDYKYQIEDLDKQISGYVQPEDDIANSSANIIASMARNAPELIAVSLGAAAVTYFTGGMGTAAYLATVGQTALSGAIIYNDTYKLEAGEMLESLKDSNLTLDQKIKVSEDYANISALIEASGALFGLTKLGGKAIYKGALSLAEEGASRFTKKTAEEFVEKAAKRKLMERFAKKAIMEKLADPKYIAYIGKKTFEHAFAATGEGAQEVTQQIFQDAFIQAIEDGENPENIDVINNVYKVLADGSNSSKYGQLLLNVFLSSLLISGSGSVTTGAVKSGYQELVARSMKNMTTDEVSQRIIDLKKNSQAYQKSQKAYAENTAAIANAGNAPESVTFDANKMLGVLDEAEKKGDTSVLQKLNELGVTRDKLEASITGSGVFKVDFGQFDSVVLDPNDTSLFQKVRGEYTFDETTLTQKELEVLMQEFATKRPELNKAFQEKNSAFNIVMRGLAGNKNFTPKQRVYNAVAAQLMMNRVSTFEGGEGRNVDFDILNREQKDLNAGKEDLFMFIRGDSQEVAKAEQLKKNGVNDKEILKQTGLHYDKKYKQWFKEISDKDVKFKKENFDKLISGDVQALKVEDIIEHDELLNMFYIVRVLPVVVNKQGDFRMALRQQENKTTGEITPLRIEINPNNIKSATEFSDFMHEVQHAVQAAQQLPSKNIRGSNRVPAAISSEFTQQEKINKILFDKIKDKVEVDGSVNRFVIEDVRPLLEEAAKTDPEIAPLLTEWDRLDKIMEPYIRKTKPSRYLEAPEESQARDTEYRLGMTEEERAETLPFGATGRRAPFVRFKVGRETVDVFNGENRDMIAGTFSDEYGKYIIKLTEAANPTTFLHEFNHLVVTDMLKSFNSGNMTEYWQGQTQKIADFVGAKVENGQLHFTEAQYEKIAEAFGSYMKEGRAPVESLSDLFGRMRDWFVDVYKKLTMNNVKLNKSIRNAFDSLLVSKEEMDQAIIDKNLRAIGRRSWVKESDYQQYLSDLAGLNRVSTSKHLEAIRKKARMATEEKNKQKLDEIRKEVDAQVSQDPRYLFVDDVRNRKINKGDIPPGYKIRNASAFVRDDGIPVEQFITDHEGVVDNVADVVELLNNLEDKATLVERTAQEQFSEWLNREYPELADVEAKAAASNIELVKVRLKEYMMLNNIPMSQFNQYYNELVKAANAEIESMKLRELTNIERLLDLETRIVTKARMAKTDKELANALWHQAAVDYIIMRAKDIRTQVNRFNRHFDKYRYLPHTSDLKRIDAYDFDMITGVLRNLGFTKKRPRVRDVPLSSRLTQWIDDKMSTSFSDAEEIRDFIPSLSQETGVKFDNNTYHDFAIFDVLTRLIESISKSDKELTEVNKQELRQKDISEVADYQKGKNINASFMSWWTDNMVMKEQFLKKIFPKRQFLDYVVPFVDAMTLREQRIARNDEAIATALQDMVKNQKQIFTVPLASGGILNMTYVDMQVAVLNIDNMETWIESWNAQKGAELTTDDFLSIIEAAPQKMIDNAQKVWNVFESQKQEFREAQYKMNGFLMDYVEPRSITLSDGRTIQSGYYPRGKIRTTQQDFSTMVMSFQNNGVYTMATSKFAKDRLENAKHSELDLTINSLRSWLYHTATVIEVGPKFNKLSKMINDQTMVEAMGREATKSLNDWMKYSIVGDNLNKFYATLDKISSVQILGWEPIRAAVQAFGWIPAMSTVGPQWIAPQFLKGTSYVNLFNVASAAKLSPYMRERYENAVNHIAGMTESNQLIRSGKSIADKIMNVAMWFTVHGDAFSSYILWNAAYEKARAEGFNDSDAVLMADSAVRTSQGDSTAVSRPKILQGDKRVITKFASYFIAMNSRVSSAIVGKDRAELVAITMLAGIVAPVVEAYIRSAYEWAIGSDDDKKKWRKLKLHSFEDVLYYNMKQNVLSTVGQTAVPIAGIGGYVGNLLATGNAYDKPLPMLDYLYSLGKTVSYPVLAATADTARDKDKYVKGFEKSLLKSLTIPNKFIRMMTE